MMIFVRTAHEISRSKEIYLTRFYFNFRVSHELYSRHFKAYTITHFIATTD